MSDVANRFRLHFQFANKTDSELQRVVQNNALKAAASNSVVEMETLVEESEYCSSLLQARANARKEWRKTLPDRKRKAILNLKTAATPNGQLIAAILEDEGSLTVEEICSWCEELHELGQDKVQKILDELVSEGVLKKNGKAYYSYIIYTKHLFPEHPADWALKTWSQNGFSASDDSILFILLQALEIHGEAMDPTDFLDVIAENKSKIFLAAPKEKRSSILYTIDTLGENRIDRIKRTLTKCCNNEILSNARGVYYFPMVGEGTKK